MAEVSGLSPELERLVHRGRTWPSAVISLTPTVDSRVAALFAAEARVASAGYRLSSAAGAELGQNVADYGAARPDDNRGRCANWSPDGRLLAVGQRF